MKVTRVRKPDASELCPRCKKDVSTTDFLYCPYCGESLTAHVVVQTTERPPDVTIGETLAMIAEICLREGYVTTPSVEISDSTTLDDLGLDSLGQVELIMCIEEAWDVNFPEDRIDTINLNTTLRELAETLLALRQFVLSGSQPEPT